MSAPALRIVCTFQSTLSVRRATFHVSCFLSIMEFQSTLSVRRATVVMVLASCCELISIHALRKESDDTCKDNGVVFNQFQSTLSVRRATSLSRAALRYTSFQSTLSVRRATLLTFLEDALAEFQSTLSVRRATPASPTR